MPFNYTKHLVYPLFWKWRGMRVQEKLKDLERTQWFSLSEIEEIQWRRLQRLLRHAYKNVPYYRNKFNEFGLTPEKIKDKADFAKLPVLTKWDIRDNFGDISARNIKKEDMRQNSTGGSTGENLFFLVDKIEGDYRTATTIRADRWAGLDIGDKYAQIWGAPMDALSGNRLRKKIADFLIKRMFLSSYTLSKKQMNQYAVQIRKYRPRVIIGYPSPLYHFSSFLKSKGIDDIEVNSVITSAEVLLDHQRELIESTFHCPVFDRYGCREFGNIAMECPEHNGLHIHSDRFYVECVRDGRQVQNGELGELLITDLHKYGMSFIRYQIGDIGMPSGKRCSCGRGLPMLEKIGGRVFDIVVGTDGRYVAGTFWTLLFRSVSGIEKFQVVQESKRKIDIKIVKNAHFKEEYIKHLSNKIYDYCGKDTEINFKFVDTIPLTKSGKFRFVISKVPVSFV